MKEVSIFFCSNFKSDEIMEFNTLINVVRHSPLKQTFGSMSTLHMRIIFFSSFSSSKEGVHG